MKMLLSDNNSGVHPKIMEAIINANNEHEMPYGNDVFTQKGIKQVQRMFEKDVEVFFVTNGTSANVIGLSSILDSYEAVVCPDTAHIHVDECGALERFTGAKIIQVPNKNGKIKIEELKGILHLKGDEHHSQPKVISISQVTEMGTVYSTQEIKALSDFAHQNDMYLHIDGARIANAAVALNVSFKEMIADTGVDILSFGGTKNGMMYGEAIVVFNPTLSSKLKFIRKQGMQLMSKMRYISAQFLAYIKDDLWKENAMQANKMAHLLYSELIKIPQVNVCFEVKANMIFAHFPKEWIQPLQEQSYFYEMDEETGLTRLVTSYDTNEDEINAFINKMKQLVLST